MVAKKTTKGVRKTTDTTVEAIDDAGNKFMLWVGAALLIVACLLAAYFLFTPAQDVPELSEILDDVSEANAKVETVSGNIEMEMTVSGGGSPQEITILGSVDMKGDRANKKMATVSTSKMPALGIPDQTTRTYIIGDISYVETVDQYSGETYWIKQEGGTNIWDLDEEMDLSLLILVLDDKVILENKNGKDAYKISMKPEIKTLMIELIKSQMSGEIEALGLGNTDEMIDVFVDAIKNLEVMGWVDTETNLLTAMEGNIRIELDLADLMDVPMAGLDTQMKLEIRIDGVFEYNIPVNIQLPKEAEDAIEINDLYNDSFYEVVCGDGWCDLGEDEKNCPIDCAVVCGDGWCDLGENETVCPEDCAEICGNGWCDWSEDSASCPGDCYCGDYWCDDAEDEKNCPEDCDFVLDYNLSGICTNNCGDGNCDEIVCMGTGCPCAENEDTCPEDCKTGDKIIG